MFLVTAATPFEMEAFQRRCPPRLAPPCLITGIGPVETALRLTAFLATAPPSFTGVLNIGSAGAYWREEGGAGLLDVCLAECEVLGDLGICHEQAIEGLGSGPLEVRDSFPLDRELLDRAAALLAAAGIAARRGPFVTVSCVSATRRRGDLLAALHQGLCENMEGAAAARVCAHFHLPLLELRCVSNMVEDRDRGQWKMKQACARCGEAAALVLKGLTYG